MNKIETMLDTLVIRYGDRSYSEKTYQLYLEARKDILDEFDRLRTDSILLTRDIALRDLTISQRDERIATLVKLLDEEAERCALELAASQCDFAFYKERLAKLEADTETLCHITEHFMTVEADEEGVWFARVPRRWGHYPTAKGSTVGEAVRAAVLAACKEHKP